MNSTDRYRLDPDDLPPAKRDALYDHIWRTLRLAGYHVLRSAHDSTGTSKQALHIPQVALDGDDPHEPYTDLPTDALACPNRKRDQTWRTKPPSTFPPGFSPVCSYCLYAYVTHPDTTIDADYAADVTEELTNEYDR